MSDPTHFKYNLDSELNLSNDQLHYKKMMDKILKDVRELKLSPSRTSVENRSAVAVTSLTPHNSNEQHLSAEERNFYDLKYIGVDDRLTTPPGSPSTYDTYLIIATATGDWAGKEDQIARSINEVWVYYTPVEGDRVWVLDDNKEYHYNGSAWVLMETLIDHDNTANFASNEHFTEASIDHGNISNVTTSQHHTRYADSEAVDALEAVSGEVLASGDSMLFVDATDGIMKKELVSDIDETMLTGIKAYVDQLKSDTAITTFDLFAGNGASISAFYGMTIVSMPNADADCYVTTSFVVPSWISTTATFKIAYFLSSTSTWSWTVSVTSFTSGDDASTNEGNILSADTSNDIGSTTADQIAIHSISINSANLVAGDIVALTLQSDASNSPILRIINIWLEDA